jgi:hypothetical protein
MLLHTAVPMGFSALTVSAAGPTASRRSAELDTPKLQGAKTKTQK